MSLRPHLTLRRINYLQIIRVIGWLLMIEAVFMAIPLATSLLTDHNDLIPFAIGMAVTLTAGLAATFAVRPPRTDMAKREGFLLTALVWVVFSAFGMIPFILSDTDPLSVTDGFFEAMSGFTTTGASVLSAEATPSAAAIIWRSLMQWLGGMGIILFTLAVIPMLNSSGGMQMFNAEVTGITHDKIRPRISQTATRLWGIYIILSGVLFVLLCLGPMTPFDALCHTFTTISTGGYSARNPATTIWNSYYTETVLTIFMLIGGINFSLIYKAAIGRPADLWRNDVTRVFLRSIILCFILFVIAITAGGNYTGPASVTIDPIFQVVSSFTSTGFTAPGFTLWGPFVMGVTLILMFFGGCAGSTSGGAKLDRLIFLVKHLRNELYLSLHPNDVMRVRINDRIIPAHIISKVVAFLCFFVIIAFVGGLALSAMGLPLTDALFSSFSCLTNVGYSPEILGDSGGYSIIPAAGKWLLALLMLTGRLEIFTILIILTPGFWRK